jgi:hypothetical protein
MYSLYGHLEEIFEPASMQLHRIHVRCLQEPWSSTLSVVVDSESEDVVGSQGKAERIKQFKFEPN